MAEENLINYAGQKGVDLLFLILGVGLVGAIVLTLLVLLLGGDFLTVFRGITNVAF